ncbi:MAG: hypothetical protein WA081_17300, partial [Desulfosalsimonadaceae bacterium]
MKVNYFLMNKSVVNQKISFRDILRIAFLFLFAIISTAEVSAAAVISSNTTINAEDTTYDGQPITVDGAYTLTINGAHHFESISLINGAKITHTSNSTAQVNTLALSITNDVTIDESSLIDVSGRGYTTDQGPGKGVSGNYGGGGGGHGGNGGNGTSGPGGAGYDSVVDPSLIGSGGGKSTNGGRAGGAGG